GGEQGEPHNAHAPPRVRDEGEHQREPRRREPARGGRQDPRERRERRGDGEQREGVQCAHVAPMARSASGKRAAVRRGRACSTAATRAKVTALSPKSETKLPKKHAPNGASPSALPSAVVSAIPPVVVQPNTKYEMGVEVSDAITPRPSPAGTAVLQLRNRPARAASPAYSATTTGTAADGPNLRLRSGR